MEIIKSKKILYIALIFFIIFLLVFVLLLSKKQSMPKSVGPTPSVVLPTTVQLQNTVSKTPSNVMTPTPPDFTGGTLETVPRKFIDLSQQDGALKKILPYSQSEFSITYDYREAMFIVTISEPKTENKQVFETWKSSRYPLLKDADFFIFK